MKIRHSHGRHGSTFTFTFILSLFTPFLSVATDTIKPTHPLTINQTLVSNNQVFELGFFDLGGNHFYLGIWYKQIQPKTYVWVANRDTPINSSSVNLTISGNGNVVIVEETVTVTGTAIWSSNQTVAVANTVAQLLDSGNFVLRSENDENPDNFIWESFDNPTDTLLPGMILGWGRKSGVNRALTAWKTNSDPGSGDFFVEISMDGFPEFVTWNKGTKTCRSGPWNGRRFSGVPEMKGVSVINFEFRQTSDEVSYSFQMVNSSLFSRLMVDSSGSLQRYIWIETTRTWSLYWSFPRDICDHYGECGPFGVCDSNSSPICKCLQGFRPRNRQAWVNLRDGSGGCVRDTELGCWSDGFLSLKNMKLPDASRTFVNRTMGLSECREVCMRDCSCSGFANTDVTRGGSGCVTWSVDLMDMRQYTDTDSGGQNLYVRVAAADLDQAPTTRNSENGSSKDSPVVVIVAVTVGTFLVLITLLILVYLKRKNMRQLKKFKIVKKGPSERTDFPFLNDGINATNKRAYYNENRTDELELPLFDFTTLAMATDNFSDENKLGQGGFGCVYKGTLIEGEVVAVKRLSRVSDQGIDELKNEVQLIAKLQHRNLVRLVGCCIEVDEKLLIYEFMENKSLNQFIFEKEKSAKLDWQLRYDIICGIARGLLYLHQDSRFKIIHRDLKASNILLDSKMNPKISDFGMARIFGSDQTEAETKKVVGTYGYMSPEYAMDGHFSTKSDVFSFGVLILEIVSGQKNRGSSYTSSKLNLLGHIWTLWKEGRVLELMDESLGEEYYEDEALRCIQIGLLCVQEQSKDRPDMSKVLFMLTSETVKLPLPKYPGFFVGKGHTESKRSNKLGDSMTVNEATISVLDGR